MEAEIYTSTLVHGHSIEPASDGYINHLTSHSLTINNHPYPIQFHSSHTMHTFLLLPPLLYLLHILYKSLTSPLLTLPGPFWTRFTKLWYFNRVRSAHFETDNINLHQRYGPIVRISPDHYSIADPAAVKTIYGTGSKFTKSAWYEGWKHPSPERWTLFPDRDVRRHGKLSCLELDWLGGLNDEAETRKRFSSLYSMSSLVHYEAFVDDCADIFSRRLEEHADKRQELNMGHWFQCYAFDVISSITFGGRFGIFPLFYFPYYK